MKEYLHGIRDLNYFDILYRQAFDISTDFIKFYVDQLCCTAYDCLGRNIDSIGFVS